MTAPDTSRDRERLELAAQAAFAAFGHDVATPMPWDQAPEDFRITFRMVADAVLMITEPERDTARADLAAAREQVRQWRAHLEAIVEGWDEVATSEPCSTCSKDGVALWDFDDDQRMDTLMEHAAVDLRAALEVKP